MMIIYAYGLTVILLTPFLWGVTSYVIFFLICKNENKWKIAGIVSSIAFFIWDDVICKHMLGTVGMNFQNSDLLGSDWSEIALFFEMVLSVGLAFLAFFIGRVFLKKIKKRIIG